MGGISDAARPAITRYVAWPYLHVWWSDDHKGCNLQVWWFTPGEATKVVPSHPPCGTHSTAAHNSMSQSSMASCYPSRHSSRPPPHRATFIARLKEALLPWFYDRDLRAPWHRARGPWSLYTPYEDRAAKKTVGSSALALDWLSSWRAASGGCRQKDAHAFASPRAGSARDAR